MRFDILTIFPDFFHGPGTGVLSYGVVSRALRDRRASAHIHDLRTVDDRPFGGGEGMVLKPQPIFEALESLGLAPKSSRDTMRETVILLSAQGKRFTQTTARRLSTLDRIVLICGRYEGVDERVSQLLCDEELSIGDYVLSGGELPAAVLLDTVVRLLPGVLGHADSSRYESFGEGDTVPTSESGAPRLDSETWVSTNLPGAQTPPRSTNASNGLLDYPHYTRPAEFLGVSIPEPLGNGDHQAIRRWRRQAALAKTLANRPDLLTTADLTDDDREFLATLGFDA
jgi:tRNA (guanine37-N1)-methyltransferase